MFRHQTATACRFGGLDATVACGYCLACQLDSFKERYIVTRKEFIRCKEHYKKIAKEITDKKLALLKLVDACRERALAGASADEIKKMFLELRTSPYWKNEVSSWETTERNFDLKEEIEIAYLDAKNGLDEDELKWHLTDLYNLTRTKEDEV